MNADEKKLAGVLPAQLQFVRDGYNFQGSEAEQAGEFEQLLVVQVIKEVSVFEDLSELDSFVEGFCSSYETFNPHYIRAVKQQIPYAVQQCLLS